MQRNRRRWFYRPDARYSAALNNWSVCVHESATKVRDFGAGIWLEENGVRVLNAIGAADEALSGCTEVPDWQSWDRHGHLIDYVAMDAGGTGCSGGSNPDRVITAGR